MLGASILLKKKIPAFTVVDCNLFYIQVIASQTSYYMVSKDTELEHIKNLVSACVPDITPPFLVLWIKILQILPWKSVKLCTQEATVE